MLVVVDSVLPLSIFKNMRTRLWVLLLLFSYHTLGNPATSTSKKVRPTKSVKAPSPPPRSSALRTSRISVPVPSPSTSKPPISRSSSSSTASQTRPARPPDVTSTQPSTAVETGRDGSEACRMYCNHHPSFEAAILFSAFFGIATVVHIVQAFYYKKAFCWVISMGSAWELGAFAIRAIFSRNQHNILLAIISNMLMLLAPFWIQAFEFGFLARMVHFFLPKHTLFRIGASDLVIILVSMNLLPFVVQFTGGAVGSLNASLEQQTKGVYVCMAGIGLQELFILIFVGIAVKFHLEWLKVEDLRAANEQASPRAWRLVYVLYVSLGLMTIRMAYRLAEYCTGEDSHDPLQDHEVFLYTFEAVPMLILIVLSNIFHPGRVLTGPGSEIPPSKLWRCGSSRKEEKSKEEKTPKQSTSVSRRTTVTSKKIKLADLESISERPIKLGPRELDFLERQKGSRFSPF